MTRPGVGDFARPTGWSFSLKDGVGGAVEAAALGVGAGQRVERRKQVLLVKAFLENAFDDVETGRSDRKSVV